MYKLSKIFLVLFIAGFALSLAGPGADFGGGMLKPLSAICFIAFYITNLLKNEIGTFDLDQQAKLASAGQGLTANSKADKAGRSGKKSHHTPSFAGAGTH